MTITIRLDDAFRNDFQLEAESLGISVDQLADDIIRRHAQSKSGDPGSATDPAFRSAMEASFRESDELYRRLAK